MLLGNGEGSAFAATRVDMIGTESEVAAIVKDGKWVCTKCVSGRCNKAGEICVSVSS